MTIIIISSNTPETASYIGEKVALDINYKFISSQEINRKVSEKYGVSEETLVKAFDPNTKFYRTSTSKTKKYIVFLQSVLTSNFLDDNIVYSGCFCHFLIRGVSHIVKIMLMNPDEKIVETMVSQKGIPAKRAVKIVRHNNKKLDQWSNDIFKQPYFAVNSFDLMINLQQIAEDAVEELIIDQVTSKRFQTMTYSKSFLENLELATRVKAELIQYDPEINITARDGIVSIEMNVKQKETGAIRERIETSLSKMKGVSKVNLTIRKDLFSKFADTMR